VGVKGVKLDASLLSVFPLFRLFGLGCVAVVTLSSPVVVVCDAAQSDKEEEMDTSPPPEDFALDFDLDGLFRLWGSEGDGGEGGETFWVNFPRFLP